LPPHSLILAGAALASGLLCAGLIRLLMPALLRYALARPNARSSHRAPTPQGGGIAVVAACLVVALACSELGLLALSGAERVELRLIALAALALALVGAVDDIRPLPVGPRLALQTLCVAAAIMAAPGELRLFGDEVLPLALERLLAVAAGVWFVNLTNFMDGIDLITVADTVPPAAAIAAFAAFGLAPAPAGLVAAALGGAMLGFAPRNRPVARLFLGDVGSLSIGLLLAWCLYRLAGAGGLVAAIILVLYPVADATITLLRRMARGDRVWEPHRSHYYQRATTNGWSVARVSGAAFALNILLAVVALGALLFDTPADRLLGLLEAAFFVWGILFLFQRRRP